MTGSGSLQKLRLFWAVNPPPAVREKIYLDVGRLRGSGADAKWVEENNLHITVKFLGDTDPGMVERLAESAAGRLQGFRKFRIDFNGLGFFPGPRNPRVLWVRLAGDVKVLGELASAVEDSMFALGFPGEGRNFSPHLTLARIRSPRNVENLVQSVNAGNLQITGPGGFEVNSVDLMSSTLSRGGPVYRLLASVSLGK